MRRIYWTFLLLAACGKPSGKPREAPRDTHIIDQGRPEAVLVNLGYDAVLVDSAPARRIVEFSIPAGTGKGSWNTQNQRLTLFQGQILRIRNDDSIAHTLHTFGRPCEHGPAIQPGESFDCPLDAVYDARSEGPLYDHEFQDGKFWFTVLPSPAAVLAANCLSCHSKARATAGLDLESSPVVTRSADIKSALAKRLAKDATDAVRMPPATAPLASADAESLIAWADAGFFKVTADSMALVGNRSIRWQQLDGTRVLLQGDLTGQEKSLTFARSLAPTTLRFEELIDGQWVLLVSIDLTLDRDRNVTLPAKPLAKQMPAGYYGIDDLYRYAVEQRITSVEEFLKILPQDMHDNFVLVKESRSRHLSSAQYPRGILFSKSARLLLGFSSHPDDPLRETVELTEAMEDGNWKYREIRFEKKRPLLNSDDSACRSCHSEKPRPIWGSYPDWPGVYGDSGSRVSPDEYAILKQLSTNPQTKDRFATVNIDFRDDLNVFNVSGRFYNFPNTVLNLELGRTAARVLALRVKQRPDAKAQFARLLQRDYCGMYEPLDLFSKLDIDMRVLATDRDAATDNWNEGQSYLPHLISYWAFMQLLPDHPLLQEIFAPVMPKIQAYARMRDAAGLEVSTDDILDFRPHQYVFPRVLGNEKGELVSTFDGPGLTARRADFCKELARIAQP